MPVSLHLQNSKKHNKKSKKGSIITFMTPDHSQFLIPDINDLATAIKNIRTDKTEIPQYSGLTLPRISEQQSDDFFY